ncbi:hypothetical protein [Streptomyces sp. NPDC058424]|uniref:hypothetical protein n=1 Tax=Streptomyces sp. NPDC058424 TaxID=3346491 RepID=UPI003652697E
MCDSDAGVAPLVPGWLYLLLARCLRESGRGIGLLGAGVLLILFVYDFVTALNDFLSLGNA